MGSYVNMSVPARRSLSPPLDYSTLAHFTHPLPVRFNTSRIPAIPSDTYTRYPSSNGQNDHVIVMRNGRYFKVKVGGLGAEEVDK
jgi:hypothetical protein